MVATERRCLRNLCFPITLRIGPLFRFAPFRSPPAARVRPKNPKPFQHVPVIATAIALGGIEGKRDKTRFVPIQGIRLEPARCRQAWYIPWIMENCKPSA